MFKNEVCSGALLARCYFEATEINQLKAGLKSTAQYLFFWLFKERVSYMSL